MGHCDHRRSVQSVFAARKPKVYRHVQTGLRRRTRALLERCNGQFHKGPLPAKVALSEWSLVNLSAVLPPSFAYLRREVIQPGSRTECPHENTAVIVGGVLFLLGAIVLFVVIESCYHRRFTTRFRHTKGENRNKCKCGTMLMWNNAYVEHIPFNVCGFIASNTARPSPPDRLLFHDILLGSTARPFSYPPGNLTDLRVSIKEVSFLSKTSRLGVAGLLMFSSNVFNRSFKLSSCVPIVSNLCIKFCFFSLFVGKLRRDMAVCFPFLHALVNICTFFFIVSNQSSLCASF